MYRCTVFGLALALLAGCVNPEARLQMAEEAETRKDLAVKTVGDVADITVVGPVQVSGIALVTGLDGTGGSPQGPYRQHLDQVLRKQQKVENVKEILDSPDNAIVLITSFIMPSARVGDRFDVEVTLPPGSKATSLAGGTLQICALRNHDTTKSLLPDYDGPDRLLQGHVMAHAKGPVMVGLGDGTTASDQKKGRVWRGAASHIELPYYLVLKKDDKSMRVAQAVAERLNYLFQEDPQRAAQRSQAGRQMLMLEGVAQQVNHNLANSVASLSGPIAKAKSKEAVEMRVPYSYRLNPERSMYVARLVPLAVDAEQMGRYKRRLQKLLAEPGETVMAARRLEALGRDSALPLREGLTHPDPLVRFSSAEALAYLGDLSGAEELSKLARQYPLLAGSCVIALASLDEPSSRQRLAEMLNEPDTVLRSTAFRMLRQLAEGDAPETGLKTAWGTPYHEYLIKNLGGEYLAGSFWLHRVAPRSSRLVSFASDSRAEVVLFGDGIGLTGPVRALVGPAKEFALTYEAGSDKCVISRISAQLGRRQTLCQPSLEEIIRALAELGAEYSDIVDLIRKLEERQCLNSPVRLHTAPPEVTPQMLVDAQRDGTLLRDDTGELQRKVLSTAAPQ
jgi:flagellar basal body P-ring protein FlgI